MNKNINLVEILKDCPRGTKLYSIMHGVVEFEEIKNNNDYRIVFKYKGKDNIYYEDTTTIDGKFNINSAGECTLFPAEDQRDWSKFSIEPKFDINNLEPFDKVLVRDMDSQKWHCHLFDRLNKDKKYVFNCIIGKYYQCVPYNEDTKHLVGSTEMPPKKYVTWEV